ASRHLRTITRRIVTVLASGEPEPELAALLAEVGHGLELLGASLDDPAKAHEARTALSALAARLDPALLGGDAGLRETLVVVLSRPLVVDLLIGAGMSREDAVELLPPI